MWPISPDSAQSIHSETWAHPHKRKQRHWYPTIHQYVYSRQLYLPRKHPVASMRCTKCDIKGGYTDAAIQLSSPQFQDSLTTLSNSSGFDEETEATLCLPSKMAAGCDKDSTAENSKDSCDSCNGLTKASASGIASLVPNTAFAAYLARKTPATLRQQLHSTRGLDKIFASVWLSERLVVVGTKCDKLVIINVDTGETNIVPDTAPDQPSPPQPQAPWMPLFQQCSGIHALAINPSKTFLAAGSGRASENIKIYSLPSFALVALLHGHSDVIFSLKWVDDNSLISGSRDKSVKTWKIDKQLSLEAPLAMFASVKSRIEHRDKVRDLALDRDLQNVFTLSADGSVKIWDMNIETVAHIPLTHTFETVCLAVDQAQHMLSVGSQSHVSILDPRAGAITSTFESLDQGWGVRSLQIRHGIVTVGGGLGRISFFDLRNQKYLDWDTNLSAPLATDSESAIIEYVDMSRVCNRSFLESSAGWLHRDPTYMNHFFGIDIKSAIYTLEYDDSGSRLFAAGGPLQLSLKGSYASVWQ